MNPRFERWLSRFALHHQMRPHVADVLAKLPTEVLEDLLEDPQFLLGDYDPTPGAMVCVPVGMPGRGQPGRAVMLKRTLLARPAGFVKYVIAHELAHAFLRNAGDHPHEPAERDADRLAADWGFPRP